jgi:hypothetical protein
MEHPQLKEFTDGSIPESFCMEHPQLKEFTDKPLARGSRTLS